MKIVRTKHLEASALCVLTIAAIIAIAVYASAIYANDQPSITQDPVEVSVKLTPNGFDPAEVVIPAQRFQLSLDNRTDLKEIVLRLSREDGSQSREMRVAGAGGDWSETFDLQPGKYILSEMSHDDWVCHLKVQP